MSRFYALLIVVPLIILQGCAAAVVGAGATGAAVAADRRTAGSVIDDQGIEIKARREFAGSDELWEQSNVSVTSYNGIVLITGETPNQQLKSKITEIVKDIPKVRKVYNEMAIAAPSALSSRSSDTWLTSKVKSRMTADKDVRAFYIKVKTERGVVYLMGKVTREEADAAVAVTRGTSGVQRVVKVFEYID